MTFPRQHSAKVRKITRDEQVCRDVVALLGECGPLPTLDFAEITKANKTRTIEQLRGIESKGLIYALHVKLKSKGYHARYWCLPAQFDKLGPWFEFSDVKSWRRHHYDGTEPQPMREWFNLRDVLLGYLTSEGRETSNASIIRKVEAWNGEATLRQIQKELRLLEKEGHIKETRQGSWTAKRKVES